MKTYWSAITPLLLLAFLTGCGKEQFGSAAQNNTQTANAVHSLEQLSCSSYTLIKPKVDILYVVDNSSSTKYLSDSIKLAMKYTIDTISKDFDFRVIGTTLIPTPGDSNPYDDFQFLTNSTDPYSSSYSGKRVSFSSEFTFFQTIAPGGAKEAGLSRTINFINANKGSSTSLFRNGAYHLVVLISNGRDTEVETYPGYGDVNQTQDVPGAFSSRLNSFNLIKSDLNSQQFRFIAATTASTNCLAEGSLSSKKSYIKMANTLYDLSGATDSPSTRDSYDLCSNEAAGLFAAVNNSIQQVVLNHKYKYWPITFTNDDFDTSKIKVFKTVGNNPPVQITSGWTYRLNPNYPGGFDTRIEPTVGEPTTARHLIEFSSGNEIEYPECVSVTSTTKTEYFGYIVLPQAPKLDQGVTVRINGAVIPQNETNGWSYVGYIGMPTNIKVPHPNAGDELPAVNKTGYMIKLNGTANYYKSGDNVQVTYIAAPI